MQRKNPWVVEMPKMLFQVLAMALAMVLVEISAGGGAHAQSCHDRCTKTVGFIKVTDPVCVEICNRTSITPSPVPQPPTSLDPGDILRQKCAEPFRKLTRDMVSACQLTAGFSSRRPDLKGAKDLLVQQGFFRAQDFEGVSVQFCNLTAGNGLTPSASEIYLTRNARSWSAAQLAPLLGHEMFHIRQYRAMGYDRFACKYSENVVKGRGTQCSNELENPAYQFECSVSHKVNVTSDCICGDPTKAPAKSGGSQVYTDCVRHTPESECP